MKSDTERLERARLAYVILVGDVYRFEQYTKALVQKLGHPLPAPLPESLVNHLVELGFAIGSFEGQNGVELQRLHARERK